MIVTTFCRCGTDASVDVLADSEGELYARPSRGGGRCAGESRSSVS